MPEMLLASTAFLVIRDEETGEWFATAHLGEVLADRTATVGDMQAGCAAVLADINASRIAQAISQALDSTTHA